MSYKVIVVLIVIALSAACGQPPEVVLESDSDRAVISATQTSMQGPRESAITTKTQTHIPESTSTVEPTIETIASEPASIVIPTSQVNPTLTLTTTIVTSATFIMSEIGIYTDVRVTRSGRIHQVDWSKDGKTFALATSVGGLIYDTRRLDLIKSIYVGENVPSVLLNPSNSLAAFGSLNGDIRWVDPETGGYIATFRGHKLGVTDLVFPGQGHYLVSGSDDGSVRSWDPAFTIDPDRPGSPPTNFLKLNNRVSCVDINPNGDLAAAGSYQSWVVWNIFSGEIVLEQVGSIGQIKDIAFSPDGAYLAIADGSNIVKLWKTSDWSLSHEVEFGETDTITSIDFHPGQLRLVIGGNNGVVLQWEIAAKAYFEVTSLAGMSVSDIEVHPGGAMLLISTDNGYLRLISNQ